MEPRKKDKTTEEQTGQERENVLEGRSGQEEQTGRMDRTGQKQERDECVGIPNPCVYCGPSVRGVAQQYTTYMGGIPAQLKKFVGEHPAAKGLIVPTGRFAAVRKQLETPGTAESILFQKLKSELR